MKKIFTFLSIIGIVATATAQTNLVLNPGLENWTAGTPDTPDNWFVTGVTYVKATAPNVHSGTYAIGVTSKTTSTGGSYTSTLGASDITVTPGVTYIYSGWYLDNVNNATMRYWGQWRTATTLLTDATLQTTTNSTDSPQWVQFSVEATAPATATIARLSLRTYAENSTVGGTVYFDDVMFYDKTTLGVINIKDFDNAVKMNTIVKDELILTLPSKSTVNIYTADGKLVSSNRVDNGGIINTASLAKGMYVVTVQDNFQNKVSRKIIKQ